MPDQPSDRRVHRRVPIVLRVRVGARTEAEFGERYATNLSRGGIFLRTRSPQPVGTLLRLEVQLADGTAVIRARGEVKYAAQDRPDASPPVVGGMGIQFIDLDAESQALVDRLCGVPGQPARGRHAPVLTPAPEPTPVIDRTALDLPGLRAGFEPNAGGPVIGIDLGTTFSCAAYIRHGKPFVLPSREGYNTIPSLVALNGRGKLVVGHPARGQMLLNPRHTVYGSKRLVGRPFGSPVVQQSLERFLYEIVEGPDGEAAVRLGGTTLTLQEVAALVLNEVRELAQNSLGQPVSRAVITVPAYYNEHQREAVRRAGRLAGLVVERILSEPTAAALAYGYGKGLNRRILVYDLGGGTFDASVLELHDSVFEVISTGGDTFLGGVDFDGAVVDHLLACFEAQLGRPFDGDQVALQRVFDAAERAKCALSEQESFRVHVPFVTSVEGRPCDLDVTLDRATLETLCGPLVERTLAVAEDVLRQKKLSFAQIDDVLLVGGQSRMPLVRQRIRERFGKEPHKGVHPDEAVALGAALLGQALEKSEGVVLIDVLPMSIQIGRPGGSCTSVIERNVALPVTRTFKLSTSRDFQTSFEIHVFQGESPQAQVNEYLGTLSVNGLPLGQKGSVQAAVTFHLTAECLLQVTAKELSTGRTFETTMSTRGTPEEVRAKLGMRPQRPGVPQPVAGMFASDGSTAAMPPPESTIARVLRRWFRG
ncbi:TIGR02266 family protein [Vulgatibacter sp.]|uniref:TIGR02266 family protein n=1 Tax=Vulgatibacter sp. TaxID=1971226 RepID=UPI0035665803